MSKTLLNRLAMLEVLDLAGPLTVTELARRSGLDVTVVSRTVAACEPGGWLVRLDGKVALGPRCTLLGHNGPTAEVIARAAPLVHAVAGVTGLLTRAYGLVGGSTMLIAAAAGRELTLPPGPSLQAPLYATAGGRAIAAQLDRERLSALLPAEPYPDAATVFSSLTGTSAEAFISALARPSDSARPPQPLPRDRAELEAQLDAIRRDQVAIDDGSLEPALACIAVPWPQPALPAALVCVGPTDTLASDLAFIKHALAAAGRPGATPREVVTTAARTIDGVVAGSPI
jgi:DNA-binding IclR family transcriptional regulator